AIVCVELLAKTVVSSVVIYGGLVIRGPYAAPSSRNCTLATPWLSVAVAVSATALPDTVAVFNGAVSVTVGGSVSVLKTLTTTGAEVVRLPTRSRATAVSVWLAFDAVSVFHDTL